MAPYIVMAIYTAPVQPMFHLDGTITFESVEVLFPREEYGAASPFLCFLYVLSCGVPKYIMCDLILLTYYVGTDLECKLLCAF